MQNNLNIDVDLSAEFYSGVYRFNADASQLLQDFLRVNGSAGEIAIENFAERRLKLDIPNYTDVSTRNAYGVRRRGQISYSVIRAEDNPPLDLVYDDAPSYNPVFVRRNPDGSAGSALQDLFRSSQEPNPFATRPGDLFVTAQETMDSFCSSYGRVILDRLENGLEEEVFGQKFWGKDLSENSFSSKLGAYLALGNTKANEIPYGSRTKIGDFHCVKRQWRGRRQYVGMPGISPLYFNNNRFSPKPLVSITFRDADPTNDYIGGGGGRALYQGDPAGDWRNNAQRHMYPY